MSRLASFFHHPITGKIKVHNLISHEETEIHLNINTKIWRKGYYSPTYQGDPCNTIKCSVEEIDDVTETYCNDRLKKRFPRFADFFNWAVDNGAVVDGFMCFWNNDLSDLKFPKNVDGGIELNSCCLKGVKLPQKISSSLTLRHCDLKGIKLPKHIGRSLAIKQCNLNGVKLPQKIGDDLKLNGCYLRDTKFPQELVTQVYGSLFITDCDLRDVKLPQKIHGYFEISGCNLKGAKLPEKFLI